MSQRFLLLLTSSGLGAFCRSVIINEDIITGSTDFFNSLNFEECEAEKGCRRECMVMPGRKEVMKRLLGGVEVGCTGAGSECVLRCIAHRHVGGPGGLPAVQYSQRALPCRFFVCSSRANSTLSHV